MRSNRGKVVANPSRNFERTSRSTMDEQLNKRNHKRKAMACSLCERASKSKGVAPESFM
jgi:hypothetical protein